MQPVSMELLTLMSQAYDDADDREDVMMSPSGIHQGSRTFNYIDGTM